MSKAKDPRITIRGVPDEELERWHKRVADEFPRQWTDAHVARLLMREWYAGKIPLDTDGVIIPLAQKREMNYIFSSAESEAIVFRVDKLLESNYQEAKAAIVALLDLAEHHLRQGQNGKADRNQAVKDEVSKLQRLAEETKSIPDSMGESPAETGQPEEVETGAGSPGEQAGHLESAKPDSGNRTRRKPRTA